MIPLRVGVDHPIQIKHDCRLISFVDDNIFIIFKLYNMTHNSSRHGRQCVTEMRFFSKISSRIKLAPHPTLDMAIKKKKHNKE